MKISMPEVTASVRAAAPVQGVEPIEVSEGGTIFLRPNHIEVVYTSNFSAWEIAVTVTAILSLSREGDEGESHWGATPMYWRGGSVPRPNLDEAPEWVRLFVSRNMPVMLAGPRRID